MDSLYPSELKVGAPRVVVPQGPALLGAAEDREGQIKGPPGGHAGTDAEARLLVPDYHEVGRIVRVLRGATFVGDNPLGVYEPRRRITHL